MNAQPTNEQATSESVADRHRRLATAFQSTVDAAMPTDLPTPCEGWTIGDVIDHVTTTQQNFLTERGVDVSAEGTLASVSAAMQAALDDPAIAGATYDSYFGPTTIADTVNAFYCLDLVLHRWDIAAAAGLADHTTISDTDIETCRDLMAPMGDNIRMPGIFGDEVNADPSSSATASFVAWAGRDPEFAKI